MTFQDLQHKIDHAKALDFGTIFNNCIELFKKVWLQGFIVLLLSVLLAIPVMIVLYIPIITLGLSASILDGDLYGIL